MIYSELTSEADSGVEALGMLNSILHGAFPRPRPMTQLVTFGVVTRAGRAWPSKHCSP